MSSFLDACPPNRFTSSPRQVPSTLRAQPHQLAPFLPRNRWDRWCDYSLGLHNYMNYRTWSLEGHGLEATDLAVRLGSLSDRGHDGRRSPDNSLFWRSQCAASIQLASPHLRNDRFTSPGFQPEAQNTLVLTPLKPRLDLHGLKDHWRCLLVTPAQEYSGCHSEPYIFVFLPGPRPSAPPIPWSQ